MTTASSTAPTWPLTVLAPPPPPPPHPPAAAPAPGQAQASPGGDSLLYTPLAAISSLPQYSKVNILAVIQPESNPIPTLNRKLQAQIKLCLRDNSLPRSAPYTTLMLFRHKLDDFYNGQLGHVGPLPHLTEGAIVRIKLASISSIPNAIPTLNAIPMLLVTSNDEHVAMSVTPATGAFGAHPLGIVGIQPLALSNEDQTKINALREWWWSQTNAANLAGFSQVGGMTQLSPAPRPPLPAGPSSLMRPPGFRAPPPAPHHPVPSLAPPSPPAAPVQAIASTSSAVANRPIHPCISTTQVNNYYDLVVEIVDVKGYITDKFMTALVTDYSAKSLFEIGTFQHTFANGPVVHDHQGVLLDPHTLIPMVLFDEHKPFAHHHFKPGALVLVRNCKAVKAVSGSMDRFELKMPGGANRWTPQGVPRMEMLDRGDARVRALMERRSKMLEVQRMDMVAEKLMEEIQEREGAALEAGGAGVEAGVGAWKRRRVGEMVIKNGVEGAAAVAEGPVPASFTYIKHPYIPAVGLADILNSPDPNGKYRCRVRFTKVLPQKLVNCSRRMCRPCMVMLKHTDTQCPKCSSAILTYAFCMVLTLVDELGDSLDVHVNEPAASTVANSARLKLFPGLVPTDLSKDPITARSLLSRLAYVLYGMPAIPADMQAKVLAGQATLASVALVRPEGLRPSLDHVWCDVCIESYLAAPAPVPPAGASAAGQRGAGGGVVDRPVKYRLFDTEMREPGSGQ